MSNLINYENKIKFWDLNDENSQNSMRKFYPNDGVSYGMIKKILITLINRTKKRYIQKLENAKKLAYKNKNITENNSKYKHPQLGVYTI